MKWEYKYLYPEIDSSDDVKVLDIVNQLMNQMGQDRWELVSIHNNVAYFKRPVQPKSEAEILAQFDKPYKQVYDD